MINIERLVMLFVLLIISMGASAVTVHGPIGTLGPATLLAPVTLVVSEAFDPGVVDDVFLFDVVTNGFLSIASATATSIELDLPGLNINIFNIDNFQFALTDDTGTPLTSFANSGESIDLVGIVDGIYGILFQGIATGTAGGSVTGIVALVSAVPVPPAVWLFGSALLGLIGVSRTRKSTV